MTLTSRALAITAAYVAIFWGAYTIASQLN